MNSKSKILNYLEKELSEIQKGIVILKNKEFNLIKMINEFRWEKGKELEVKK